MPAALSFPASPSGLFLLAALVGVPPTFLPPAFGKQEMNITQTYNRISAASRTVAAAPGNAPVPTGLRIVPGKRIGRTSIGDKLTTVLKRLGPESESDASMGGRSVYTWYGKTNIRGTDTVRYQTDVFFHTPRFGESNAVTVVAKIRVTSPAFRTANGIGAGSGLEAIRRQFPGVSLLASGPDPAGKGTVDSYQDEKSGIGFDVKEGKCVAVIVFER